MTPHSVKCLTVGCLMAPPKFKNGDRCTPQPPNRFKLPQLKAHKNWQQKSLLMMKEMYSPNGCAIMAIHTKLLSQKTDK